MYVNMGPLYMCVCVCACLYLNIFYALESTIYFSHCNWMIGFLVLEHLIGQCSFLLVAMSECAPCVCLSWGGV